MSEQNGWVEIGKEAADAVPDTYVQFKTIGQEFTGKFVELKEGVSGTYGPESHYIFITKDLNGQNTRVVVNANPDLRKRFSVMNVNDIVKIVYTENKDIGKPTPMKVFKLLRYAGKTAPAVTAAPPPPPPKQVTEADISF